jgi:hypothetical protein
MSEKSRQSQSLLPGSISVCANPQGLLDCKRCQRVLRMDQIAFLTRTDPYEAFEAWCIDCSMTLSQWALIGAASMGATDENDHGVGVIIFD